MLMVEDERGKTRAAAPQSSRLRRRIQIASQMKPSFCPHDAREVGSYLDNRQRERRLRHAVPSEAAKTDMAAVRCASRHEGTRSPTGASLYLAGWTRWSLIATYLF